MLPAILSVVGAVLPKLIEIGKDNSSLMDKVANTAQYVAEEITGKTNPKDIQSAFELEPALLFEFKKQMLKNDQVQELLLMGDEDRQRAREHQVAMAQKAEDAFSRNYLGIFALVWSVMIMAYVSYASFSELADSQVQIVTSVISFLLGTGVASMFNFLFGRSKKDDDRERRKGII